MQVTETLSEGLKREFRVVVPANDLDSKVNTRLDELKDHPRRRIHTLREIHASSRCCSRSTKRRG